MIDANWQPYSLNPCLPVIYGQEVLYAARGQDARSRPAKAGIQEGDGGVPQETLLQAELP